MAHARIGVRRRTGREIDAEDALAEVGHHEELLEQGVHVAGAAQVLEAHVAGGRSLAGRGRVVPLEAERHDLALLGLVEVKLADQAQYEHVVLGRPCIVISDTQDTHTRTMWLSRAGGGGGGGGSPPSADTKRK